MRFGPIPSARVSRSGWFSITSKTSAPNFVTSFFA